VKTGTDSGIRVLVIDDDLRTTQIIRFKLSALGYEVLATTSGAEGIELVRTQLPDIVLLDIVMPEVSGLDVLDRVRSFSQTPVIIFTGHPAITRLALKIGADDSIAKPFDADLADRKIKLVLARISNRIS
jgi:DNA-binding response OmpR family regulator